MGIFKDSLKLASFVVIFVGISIDRSGAAKAQTDSEPQIIVYVSPNIGNDRTGDGSTQAPVRSISRALNLIRDGSNAIVQLAQGTYNVSSGETFPLRLKSGVVLRGNESQRGSGITIVGGGDYTSPVFASQNIAILGADRAELRGVTITNPNLNGYGLWLESTSPIIANNTLTSSNHGAFIAGNSTALISKNIFTANGISGISIAGAASPEVRDNLFQRTGFGINVDQDATPSLSGNLISGNQDGIIVQANAKPLLRGNSIENNSRNGLMIIANGFPDLGSPSDLGTNTFRRNQLSDIQNTGNNSIVSVGNQLTPEKVSGNVQLANQPNVNSNSIFKSPLLSPPSSISQKTINTFNPNSNNFSKTLARSRDLTPITYKIIPVPNSVVVKFTSEASNNVIPANPFVVSDLPPVVLKPPTGEPVNQPIIIAPSTIINPANRSLNPSPPRYRVIVPLTSKSSITQIRQIFPNAFPSRHQGRQVVQIGAFSDRSIALAQVRKLSQSGFLANIEDLNP